MDEDLEHLTESQLIAEVKRLRAESASIATAPGMTCVGIIPSCGGFFRSK